MRGSLGPIRCWRAYLIAAAGPIMLVAATIGVSLAAAKAAAADAEQPLYAYLAEDAGPDDEGIAAHSAGRWMMPLVGADADRISSLRPAAEGVARLLGRPVRLVRFTGREDLGVIMPDGSGASWD